MGRGEEAPYDKLSWWEQKTVITLVVLCVSTACTAVFVQALRCAVTWEA